MREKMVVVKVMGDDVILSKLEEDYDCASCVLENVCKRTDRTIKASKGRFDLKIGDVVEVEIPGSISLKASFFVYTIPLIIFVSMLVLTKSFGFSDILSFLFGIGAMGVYYTVLRLLDRSLSSKLKPRVIGVEQRSFSVHLDRDGKKTQLSRRNSRT